MKARALSLQEPDPRWFSTASPRQALIDSGPLLALFNAQDHWHGRCMDWLQHHPEVALHSTWPVLTEVCALLARRIHNGAALDFLRWVRAGALIIDAPSEWSLGEMLSISERFANLPLDLADASIAEAAERLHISFIVSIDQDFDIYRDAHGQSLVNLLR